MAEYRLEDVRKAAQQLNIEYRGRKVQRDAANLGYEICDVADCLCQLTERDFKKHIIERLGRQMMSTFVAIQKLFLIKNELMSCM